MQQFISTYRNAFPDLRFTVEDQIAEEDRVVTRSSGGTHRGELMGIAPTNREVTTSGITISIITGGESREVWVDWDALGMMRQLGVTPEIEEMARQAS